MSLSFASVRDRTQSSTSSAGLSLQNATRVHPHARHSELEDANRIQQHARKRPPTAAGIPAAACRRAPHRAVIPDPAAGRERYQTGQLHMEFADV